MTAGGGQYFDRWAGFSVHRPAGWHVRLTNSIVTVSEDVAGMVAAMFLPFRMAEPISANMAAQQFVAQYRAIDPSFQAWMVSQQPLVLRTEGHIGGRTLDGLYSVATQAENGLIAGFQAPRELAQSLAPVLGEVAGSFSLTPRVPRERFLEPAEAAFTVLYPQGWSIGGSVNRTNAYGAALPGFQAGNGSALVQNWLREFSFVETIWAQMPGQQKLKYVPATQFAATWLPKLLQREASALSVEEIVERPDQVPPMALELAKAGLAPDRYDLSAATLQFTQVRSEQNLRVRLGIAVQRSKDNGIWSMNMNPTAWTAMITSSMQASIDEFETVAPLLTGVLDSYQKNPQWEYAELMRSRQVSMQMQQQAMARLQQISRTLSETTNIITSGFWERQGIQDHAMHQWSNGFLGRTDVVDSQGTVYSVPNDADLYWKDLQGGNILGTGVLFNATPNLERLQPLTS